MKIKNYMTIYFLLVSATVSYSQGEWELLFPSPTTNQMVGMYFIDSQTGWAVGEYGTILKTTDGGENWTIQEIPWLFDLSDIHFSTALIGYAVGTDGFIIKTTDGGESWNQLDNDYSNNLIQILFRDENNGWAIGEKGIILHTIDGGSNWLLQTSNSLENLNGIDLIGTNGIIIVGRHATILMTDDDGQIWQPVSVDSIVPDINSFEDVYFADELHGWICGGYGLYTTLLETSDAGQTWSKISQSGGSFRDFHVYTHDPYLGPMQQIYFYDDFKTGIGLFKATNRDYGNIPFKTSDGGQNWSGVMWGYSEQYEGKGRFCVLDDNNIICTGYQGDFRYSTDKGSEWHLSMEDQRWWRHLTIGDHGQLLLRRFENPYNFPGANINQFARSSDFGTIWSEFEPVFLDSNDQLLQLDATDNPLFKFGEFVNNRDTLWSLQYAGDTTMYIFISTDFGFSYKNIGRISWDLDLFLTPDTLVGFRIDKYEIAPDTYTEIFQFFYSFDRGATINMFESTELFNFISTDIFMDPAIYAYYFLNSRTGFLVGFDGNIVKTEDTGRSWENIYSGVMEDLRDITFIDEQTGFVVGDFGRILKTDDGGETWRKTNSGTQEDIYSIGFVNDQEGWVVTEKGLRYTTDGGETWHGVPLRYAHGKYQNLVFDNAGNGYAYTLSSFGHSGYIEPPCSHIQFLRMINKTQSINNDYTAGPVTGKIRLYDNYPNPFNATTHIDYYLPRAGIVSLKIFDIQGRLVRTLTNQSQKSGHHSATWDGYSDFGTLVSSGIYIYQLQCNGQIKNHKLLLIK